MLKILHITPHLGGGVGKAISTLVLNDKINIHKVICLEKPKTKIFYEKIKSITEISSSISLIKKEIKKNHIIQIEYWPHPVLIKKLLELKSLEKKYLFWCHFSGFGFPKFHKKLFTKKNIIFSTKISQKFTNKKIDVISSATNLQNLKKPKKKLKNFFYVGSLHPSKINPRFLNIVKDNINLLNELDIYGENELITRYKKKLNYYNLNKQVKLFGLQKDILKIFSKYKYLLYLLRKDHYGSSENILIESMGQGIIPIVFNNEMEKNLIKNNFNGIVAKNENDLRNKLTDIFNNKINFHKISNNTKNFIKKGFTAEIMVKQFQEKYSSLKDEYIDFKDFFNNKPSNFFKEISKGANYNSLISYNKSGILHFLKTFKRDNELKKLKENIERNV